MNQAQRNKAVTEELKELLRLELISTDQYARLNARYPISTWDFRSLSRWSLWFGGLTAAASLCVLINEYLKPTIYHLLAGLSVLICALFWGALKLKKRSYIFAATGMEFLAALAIIGWSFTLAYIKDSKFDDWPQVLGYDLAVILALTYLLNNFKLLVLSMVIFFTWFGGITGYMYGGYFFGMNFPLRFLCAACVIGGLGFIHLKIEEGPLARYRGFSKVWMSSGLFFGEMSLWLLSIFGNYGSMQNHNFEAALSELFFYNALWAALNAVLVFVGSKYLYRMLVGYGVTFSIIQGYTLFFQHFARALDPMLTMVIAGGSAMYLASNLEKRLRVRRKVSAAQTAAEQIG